MIQVLASLSLIWLCLHKDHFLSDHVIMFLNQSDDFPLELLSLIDETESIKK